MTGVVAALIAGNGIKLLGQQVDDLAFSFVAPLCPEYDQIAHVEECRKPKLAIIT
jgi:hypothetical protein